jgi:23S rRNA (cytosine1962-C5)-methyltransferase
MGYKNPVLQELVNLFCHFFKPGSRGHHLITDTRHRTDIRRDGLSRIDQCIILTGYRLSVRQLDGDFCNAIGCGITPRGFYINNGIHICDPGLIQFGKGGFLDVNWGINFVKFPLLSMTEEKFIMFRNRLTKVYRHLSKQGRRLGISCYRIYDHDLPEFPLRIEIYGDKVYVAEYKRRHGLTDEAHDEWMEKSLAILTEIISIPRDHIFLKLRQRKPGRLGQYQKVDAAQYTFPVQENGLQFIVNLSDYLDTGLFLDHRVTRQMVREQAKGKRVLNLFAYTGSFSVYAAAGGATEVITVDLSNTYLKWAAENMTLNGFTDPAKFRYVQADVKQYLGTLPSGYFDLIVMDPPTFSNSKRMKDILDIQRDHVVLINECIRILNKGGQLYFSTNYTRFVLDKEKIKQASVKDITKASTAFDFEGTSTRYCFLFTKDT